MTTDSPEPQTDTIVVDGVTHQTEGPPHVVDHGDGRIEITYRVRPPAEEITLRVVPPGTFDLEDRLYRAIVDRFESMGEAWTTDESGDTLARAAAEVAAAEVLSAKPLADAVLAELDRRAARR